VGLLDSPVAGQTYGQPGSELLYGEASGGFTRLELGTGHFGCLNNDRYEIMRELLKTDD
jgi:hypothetical protein